jgi:hypothetical protein
MKTILYFILSTSLLAQVSQNDIKDILMLQGKSDIECEVESKELYNKFLDLHAYQTEDLLLGVGLSAASGAALGFYESNAFGYKKTAWMPEFMEDWYYKSMNHRTDGVFAKTFDWQKVFRNIDYITTIAGYNTLERYFAGKWYYAYAVYWISKNITSTLVRDKMKYDNWLYSYNVELIFKF